MIFGDDFMAKDLTNGSPFKILLIFAIPMIISVTLQQFYNICDSIIAGKILGENALAAINASYPMTNIYLGVATGWGVGTGVICSRYFGQRDHKGLKSTISTSFISMLILAITLTLVGICFNSAIIKMLKTPDIIFDDAKKYLLLYVAGLTFTFIYNLCGYVFQSIGNSIIPLIFLIFSTIFNIILDIVFLKFFNMQIEGLAIATIISQALSGILCLICLMFEIRKFKTEKFKIFSVDILKKTTLIAIPSIIQSSIISIGQLFVQSLINSYGKNVIAAYGSAFKINMLFVNIFTTISNAISNFTSQNVGANKFDRIKQGLRSGLIINLIVVIIGVFVCNVFSKALIKCFLNEESSVEIIDIGKTFLNIVTPFFILVAVKISFDGVLKGVGDMKSFMIGTMSDLIIRVSFAFILSYALNSYIGIWWSWPLGWLIGMIFPIYFYFRKINKKYKALSSI